MQLKPISVIKLGLGIQENGPVHYFFTKRCDEHMQKYVPYDEGNLAYKQKRVEVDKIIYNSPYAHYMYEGKVMGPNIPIMENGVIIRWVSPKGKPKHYTGKDIDYSKSQERGHTYAGPHWDKRMWSAEKDQIVKEVQNYIDGGKNAG